ncbi:DUF6316 family protein [Marinobacter mobilis]|uniref:DUF6316 domain-containing protein n=1 Tax=Marinobacter mobilis TaxID=488533 RepID=A0A1H2SG24_9GAMM|nr:DUF6316 family protein [Marinobacter mobilis]SDW30653.1 hypothetical protein SAMN04487960_102124 [Marinobacter mobilis]
MLNNNNVPQPFPSERFLETHLGWFAMTREKNDLGPFATRGEAEEALRAHIRVFAGLNDRELNPVYHGIGVHDSSHCTKTHCARCIDEKAFMQGVVFFE